MFGLEDKERLAASMRERVEVGEHVASKVRHVYNWIAANMVCWMEKFYVDHVPLP